MKSLCRHNTVAIFGRKTASYFFRKKYLSLTLTGFCVPKRVGYGHPFSSLRASQEFVLFGRGCLCHDIPNATVDFSCTSTRVCWAYHQLCWLWNLVFRPSAKSNRHQCLLCASEWTLIPHPTPPHPTPCVTWNLFNVAWRMCASASERAVASHHSGAQVSER